LKNNNNVSKQEKSKNIMDNDDVSIQTCNTGCSSLSHIISCGAGMDNFNSEYEEPEIICLNEGVTKQICNTGGSELSSNSSCSAGFSPDKEENHVVTTCNTGK